MHLPQDEFRILYSFGIHRPINCARVSEKLKIAQRHDDLEYLKMAQLVGSLMLLTLILTLLCQKYIILIDSHSPFFGKTITPTEFLRLLDQKK